MYYAMQKIQNTIWFHLSDILEKVQLEGQRTDQWFWSDGTAFYLDCDYMTVWFLSKLEELC